MRSTERRPRSFSDIGVRVGLLALAAVLLMALQLSGNLRPVQSLITQLTAPAQLSATGVTTSVEGFFASIARVRTLEQEYAALQTRADQLEAENNTLREVEVEGERPARARVLDLARTDVTPDRPAEAQRVGEARRGRRAGRAAAQE